MGMAGLIIEPHPPNFEKLYFFYGVQMMLKYFFGYLYWFQIFKKSVLHSVPSIPVAYPCLGYFHSFPLYGLTGLFGTS